MSGQKIGSTVGRGVAAARGIPATASHPESNVPDGATQATTETPELKEVENNKSVEKAPKCTESVDYIKSVDGKSCDGKTASGGGGGGDDGSGNGSTSADVVKPWYKRGGVLGAVVGTALGATAAVVAAPLVIGAIGFGAGGIAAGSIAASMMSSAAIANGGAIAAGSLVAVLQSIGAVGMGAGVAAGVAAAGAGVGAAVGGGVGVAADLVAGNGQAAADLTPRDGADGEAENQDDVAEALANLTLDESELQPTEDLLTIFVSESDGNLRRFSVKCLEPLQGMFDQYYVETGLSPDSVFFEFNGLRLEGSDSPAQLEIEDGNIVKALRI